MPHTPAPRSILITGASAGIGAALADAYAGPGVALTLTGRDADRLNTVAAACRAKGATVTTATVAVTDAAGMAALVAAAEARAPLDLVIANAGISGSSSDLARFDTAVRDIFAVNVDGVFNTVHPALAPMAARGGGQIAIVASIAGYRGLPGAVAYSASKAAVKVYGEGLRGMMRRHGVAVSVINPGFVKSRMTDKNKFRMPFLLETADAARRIADGLARDRGRISFPWPMAFLAWAMAALPDAVTDWATRVLPRKD